MTWFRIDDSFGSHPKVLGIPRKDRPAAIGLWTLAGVWCARNLTDGFLGPHMLDELGVPRRYGVLLVEAGLWHPAGDLCPRCLELGEEHGSLPAGKGFQFHDWHIYQPSRAQVEQTRKEDRDRKAAARAARAAIRSGQKPSVVPYDAREVSA